MIADHGHYNYRYDGHSVGGTIRCSHRYYIQIKTHFRGA